MGNRDYSFHLFIRGIILIGFSLLALKLTLTGNIFNFIAPKMMPFMYFAIITFLILGIIQVWRSGSKDEEELYCDCGVDHGQSTNIVKSTIIYSIFIIPVVTGFLFAEATIDSSVAAKRGFTGNNPQVKAEVNEDKVLDYLNDPEEYVAELEELYGIDGNEISGDVPLEHPEGFQIQAPPEGFYEALEEKLLAMDTIVVQEDTYIQTMNILDMNPDKFVGKKMEVIGFVFREEDFTEDQMVIARFGLSCCVADSSVYGTLSTGSVVKDLDNDQWVKVTGTLSKTEYNDWILPYLQIEEIELIEKPEQPYIYETYDN
ncbi:TIGR03943 family putative permease subunit [Bacillus pinisoli]|uniref:TIGR03943 family putative permease subunit n=1 Tax=Bacillus pinisoli TaxID=2901866 RepID=UPI002342E86D|nr:TIGR03943 family protein [Bacillus pinisoli]